MPNEREIRHVLARVCRERTLDGRLDHLERLGEDELPHTPDHLVLRSAQGVDPFDLCRAELVAHHCVEHPVDHQAVLVGITQHRFGCHEHLLEAGELQ